jgi:hypothetical protein
MSDREARTEAARLVRRFRDFEITNDEFVEAFEDLGSHPGERSLRAVGTAIGTTYSDFRSDLLNRGRELPAGLRSWFDRMIHFLESDLPYLWERDNFLGVALVSDVYRFLSKTVKRLAGRAPERFGLRPGPDTKQDWDVWPFQNQEDFERVCAKACDHPAK